MNLSQKMSLTTAVFLIFSVFAQAKTGPSAAHEHRSHGAHKHGAAKMAIAFEGAIGQINFEVPSEGIYGFEYVPKKDSDKKKQASGLEKLEKEIAQMVQFDSSLKCVISKDKIEVDQEAGGKHSDVDAQFKVVCEKSPMNSTIVFNVQKSFTNIKDVDVQVIVDDLQKSIEAQKNDTRIELKK